MAEISINTETAKIYDASLRVAILICEVEQAITATLMDSSEALTPKGLAKFTRFHAGSMHNQTMMSLRGLWRESCK